MVSAFLSFPDCLSPPHHFSVCFFLTLLLLCVIFLCAAGGGGNSSGSVWPSHWQENCTDRQKPWPVLGLCASFRARTQNLQNWWDGRRGRGFHLEKSVHHSQFLNTDVLTFDYLKSCTIFSFCFLGTMVDNIAWNDCANILCGIQDNKLTVWCYPSVVFTDKELLPKTLHIRDSR